jgi:hypothetical protein
MRNERLMPPANSCDPVIVTTNENPPLIFLGPTLPQPEAAALLPAHFRPPARRGNIYRALAAGYNTIVLIDGEFHGCPSVWQREIADALAEGAVVHGASSMGAIRAAELHSFGMIGHGKIFEWYRDGVIDGDDEVALGYGPPELGYPALSEPLVNIRATLQAAPPDVIAPEERDELIKFIQGLYFLERSFAALMERGPAAEWPLERWRRLAEFLRRERIDQKRQDAVAALTAVAAHKLRHCTAKNEANAERRWREERLVAEGLIPEGAINTAEIARRAGMSESEVRALRRELSVIFFVALWGHAHGVAPSDVDLAHQRACFPAAAGVSVPRLNGLLATRALADAAVRAYTTPHGTRDSKAAALAIVCEWAHDNGIECAGMQGEALADWVIKASPSHFGYSWHFGVELVETLLLRRGRELRPQEIP